MTPTRTLEQERLQEALAVARGTVLDLRSHLSDLRAAQDFLRLSRQAAVTKAEAASAELAALRAHCCALQTEREWLRDIRNVQEIRIRELEAIAQKLAMVAEEQREPATRYTELTAQRDALVQSAAALDRLARELRWENGPRAVRAVLPFARLLRWVVSGLVQRQSGEPERQSG